MLTCHLNQMWLAIFRSPYANHHVGLGNLSTLHGRIQKEMYFVLISVKSHLALGMSVSSFTKERHILLCTSKRRAYLSVPWSLPWQHRSCIYNCINLTFTPGWLVLEVAHLVPPVFHLRQNPGYLAKWRQCHFWKHGRYTISGDETPGLALKWRRSRYSPCGGRQGWFTSLTSSASLAGGDERCAWRRYWETECVPRQPTLDAAGGDGSTVLPCDRASPNTCCAQFTLEVFELSHEVEVGVDDAASLSNVVVGVFEGEVVGRHEVSEADGGWTTDAGMAVNEHFPATCSDWIWNKTEFSHYICERTVRHHLYFAQ